MPTFVQSAMNPNGTWQSDAMDQSEQANRQAAFQSAQMQNELAARALQAHLEQARMNQQGSQFEEGRADTLGMHNADILNANRMQSNAFGHEDNAQLARAAVEQHIADMQFGPDSLASRQWQAQLENQRHMQDLIFGGGAAAGGAQAPAASPDMGAMKQMPPDMAGNPMAGYGGGAMPAPAMHAAAPGASAMPGGVDPAMLQKVALYNAVLHGTQVPDFFNQGIQHQTETLQLQQAQREEATRRIQAALENGDVASAKQIASESGAQMPRVDPEMVASRPDIQSKIANLLATRDRASASFGSGNDVSMFEETLKDLVASLMAHGVSPDEAKGVVAKIVKNGDGTAKHPALADRSGLIGGLISDAAHLQSFRDTGNMLSQRINYMNSLIGQ